jgi:hypothetical protein
MTGLELDCVHEPSIDSELYFIPTSDDYHLTPNKAVGVAKRKFRDEHPDADKVSAKKMRETRNGMYVMAMAKPEPTYLDQIALRTLRDNPQAVDYVSNYHREIDDPARDHLIDEMMERDHSPNRRDIEDVQDALDRNHTTYIDLVEP